MCKRKRESLAMMLSNICTFGDPEAKAIINEIVEEVAVKRGVKRSVEELVGNNTMLKYVECLRVPDWKLVLFQAMARVFSKIRDEHHRAQKDGGKMFSYVGLVSVY